MPATPAWLAVAESAVNRWIVSSSTATRHAERLNGTALRVDIEGLMSLHVGMTAGRLRLEPQGAQPANATIAGSPQALLGLATSNGQPRRVAPGSGPGARIEGDAQVAHGYRELFRAARPDVEEELSRFTGDVAARRLHRLGSRAFHWLRDAGRTAGENLAEYLQEESRDLVNRTELEEFLRAVDEVREASDRASARLRRLELRLGKVS